MHILLSPLGLGLVLALLLRVSWSRLPRGVRRAGIGVELLLVLLCCPLGANALVWLVESRVSAQCAAPTAQTIVLLAGGFQREPMAADDFVALEEINIDRLLAAIALWRRSPGATLVISGGGPYAFSESGMLAQLAEQAGVPAAAIRREERSQSTWENAQQLRGLNPALPAQITLVSSAIHLPRALIAFRAAGFEPCVQVSDRLYVAPGGLGDLLPQSSALLKAEFAIHELIGDLLYRWRARAAPSSTPA